MRFTSFLLTALFVAVLAPLDGEAHAATALSAQEWESHPGDELIVDVKNNMGYLVRDGEATYLPFMVATGQKRTVNYLGMQYFAATPIGTWIAKERKIQSDRITFGKSGRFLRLFRGGTEHSYYGIHSFRYVDDWFESGYRYRSLGCVVVTEDIMTIIENSYVANGNQLRVTTTNGPDVLAKALAMREELHRVELTFTQSFTIE